MANFDIRNNEIFSANKEDGAKRIIFMGTGDFALPILNVLIADKKNTKVIGAITKPDAKVGRGRSHDRDVQSNPIKETVLSNGIHLWQPNKLDEDLHKELSELKPDLLVVVSYGKILPASYVKIAKHGAINIHASILPKYRGASPIQNTLINGETETGITIIQINEGLDTGPMLAQAKVPIQDKDNTARLSEILATLGANTMLKLLPDYFAGKIEPREQDHANATLCELISRGDGHVVWLSTTKEIVNRHRGLMHWPGLYTNWHNDHSITRVKIYDILPYTGTYDYKNLAAGTTFLTEQKEFCVRTQDTAIMIGSLQREGKTKQDVFAFISGNPTIVGTQLL